MCEPPSGQVLKPSVQFPRTDQTRDLTRQNESVCLDLSSVQSTVDKPPFAWQPFTPRGIAAFAVSSLGRLLVVQLLTALLVAVTVIWFVRNCWFPTITAAIDRLPAQSSIQAGRLDWIPGSAQLLAENRFLSIAVDPLHEGQARSPAHIQVEFGAADVWVSSLFGSLQTIYPKAGAIAFNFPDLKPWWGAWVPAILAAIAISVVLALLTTWAILASLYVLPAWLLGLYCDRNLGLCGSWRLAGAALIPGAFIMVAAIGLYGFGTIDVVRFVVTWALHIILGWALVIVGVLSTPKLESIPETKLNPFARPDHSLKSAKEPKEQSPNPFSPTP